MNKVSALLRILLIRLRSVLGLDSELNERNILLQAKLLSHKRHASRISQMCDAEFRVFSQWGEDGIIDWLINRLPDIDHSSGGKPKPS